MDNPFIPQRGISCAICGACTCAPDGERLALSISDGLLPNGIDEDDTIWLSQFRIIGDYPIGSRSFFLTGPCRRRGDHTLITRGSATNVSFGKIIRHRGAGEDEELLVADFNFMTISSNGFQRPPQWLILHTKCYSEIFLKACERTKPVTEDLEDLYEALQFNRCPLPDQLCWKFLSWPSPGYRRLKEEPRNKRRATHEQVAFLCDPASSDWIPSAHHHLTHLSNPSYLSGHLLLQPYHHNHSTSPFTTPTTPIDTLPLDLILSITDLLSRREILFLTFALPTTSRKLDVTTFWKRRIKRDMPWLWDLDIEQLRPSVEQLRPSVEQLPREINWRAVYYDLWNRCIATAHGRHLGLVNRKRIWERCVRLAGDFGRRCEEKREREAREGEREEEGEEAEGGGAAAVDLT